MVCALIPYMGVFLSNGALAGTLAGTVEECSLDLEITCKGFPKAILAKGNLPVVFHAEEDNYKFGFVDVEVEPEFFEVSGSLRGPDNVYDADLKFAC